MQISSFAKIVEPFDCIFFDAYGVLNGASGLFPWVEASFSALRSSGKPFYVVSNDSSNLVDGIVKKISPPQTESLVTRDQVISSGLICQHYIADHLTGKSLVYFGEEVSTGYLAAAGKVTHIRDINPREPADAFVMLGCGGMDWREGLDLCVNYIRQHQNIELLAPNPDILYFAGAKKVGIAAGSLANLIATAVNRPFRYFGKPHKIIFEFAFARAEAAISNLRPEKVLMVGDNLFTDIPGAKAMNFQSCLVLSGNTTAENFALEHERSGVSPDFIAESIAF